MNRVNNSNRNCDPQSLVQTDEKSLLQDFEMSDDGMSLSNANEVTDMILDTNEQFVVQDVNISEFSEILNDGSSDC